ncbi:MAG: PLP-dependent aminotransferase family protein [Spirochaetales bacterium]|nr:PLP-dependent aminotransferase family protein [Spirochaetales bacterium]
MILSLDKQSDLTLHRQICSQIREMIRSGRLPPGLKLPSTRTLVAEYAVSRNVFLGAFEQLQAEGYLLSRKGSGTYVSDKIDPALFPAPPENRNVEKHKRDYKVHYDFSVGNPDLSEFPLTEWGRCLRKAVSQLKGPEMTYGNPGGTLRLKRALKKHLLLSRGMNIEEDQLFICSGSHQALLLAVHSCLDKTEKTAVALENPAYNALTRSIIQAGARPLPILSDDEGISPSHIPAGEDTAMICVTPSHLFPTGTVLPIHRRLELCARADELDCFILENEFEGDLRLKGSQIPSMHFIREERILSAGTFSQIMYPAIRLGYLIVPENMISRTALWYRLLGYGVPVSVQNGMALFMEEGLLLRHYRKMKRLYQEKQEEFITLLKKEFPEELTLRGTDTGTYLCASFNGMEFNDKTAEILSAAGITADFEFRHYWPPGTVDKAPGIILGFGNMENETMEKGVRALGRAVRSAFQRQLENH